MATCNLANDSFLDYHSFPFKSNKVNLEVEYVIASSLFKKAVKEEKQYFNM